MTNMTEKKKYLIGFILGVAILGMLWFELTEGKKGDSEPSASLSTSSLSSQKVPESSPKLVTEKESAPTTKDDVEKTRPLVEHFLRTYLAFDGEHPGKHIEDARPYMTEDLYWELTRQLPRPTAEIYSQKLVKITDAHGIPMGNNIEWSVSVVTEVKDAKGNKRNEEWTYVVTLVKESGWKVEEVDQRGILD